MSDRLKDLQRQRALAQEQLAWLDQEIARETSGKTATPSASAPHPAKAAISAAVQPATPPVAIADDIIAQYQRKPDTVHSEVKRGCFVYFFAAFAAVGLVVLALYLFNHL